MATLHNFTGTSVTFGGHLTSRFLSVPGMQAHPACAHHRWVLIGSGVHGCRGPRAERHRMKCEHPPLWPWRAPDKQAQVVCEARPQPTNKRDPDHSGAFTPDHGRQGIGMEFFRQRYLGSRWRDCGPCVINFHS